MEVAEILAALGWGGSVPPVEALRAAVERFDEVVDPLFMVLEVAADDPWIISQEEIWRLNYGFFIFAAKRHHPALAPLLGYLSWAEEDAHEITGDFLTEEAARVLAAVACGDGDAIVEATRRKSLLWMAADAMQRALGIMALEGEWPMDRFRAYLRTTFEEQLPDHTDEPSLAWATLAELVALTQVRELEAPVRELFLAGRIDHRFLPEEEFTAHLANPDSPRNFLEAHPAITDPAEAVVRWPGVWKTRSTAVPVRAAPRIGRNDPCLCGSGLKYKRCCGK